MGGCSRYIRSDRVEYLVLLCPSTPPRFHLCSSFSQRASATLASFRLASPRLVSSHLVTPFPALSPIIFLRMLSLPRFSPPLFSLSFSSSSVSRYTALFSSSACASYRFASGRSPRTISKSASTSTATRRRSLDRSIESRISSSRAETLRSVVTRQRKSYNRMDGWNRGEISLGEG